MVQYIVTFLHFKLVPSGDNTFNIVSVYYSYTIRIPLTTWPPHPAPAAHPCMFGRICVTSLRLGGCYFKSPLISRTMAYSVEKRGSPYSFEYRLFFSKLKVCARWIASFLMQHFFAASFKREMERALGHRILD